ncbi:MULTISPECIES: Gfo/Idh/MocA family protein [Halomicrobium]|nr:MULTISPECIES: Gfo/Idh/MocA family oxidoreductase [Halomicrobium]QCD64948.1 Gfo/Idh/MocA family oxidoreductase [Halomicrobium mukohataei]QFR19754.1 gfo/Idh/MocA family oxidoreductase [Halomicrobium sp. ZPS1]
MEFGVLSTAAIGREDVIPAIQASEHAVGAIASRDAERARSVADELDIDRSYGSYEALLADEGIDAVYNPLPNSLHAEWTRRAADHGLHVLCEKPLTPDAEQARALFDYCDRQGVTLMEAFMYHFHPRTERAREIVREELGEVRHVEATFTFGMGDRTDDIRLDPALDGGSLMDIGCYAVSAVRNVLGEPNRAFAHAADTYDTGVDSQLSGLLTYDDGVTAQITSSFDTPMTHEYRIMTADGWLHVPEAFDVAPDQSVSLTYQVDGQRHTETIDGVDHYRRQVESFADAVAADETPPVDRTETVDNMAVIDALYESAETGEPAAVDGE